MKLFISAGEPSGDLHGANLIRSILARDPAADITALGGPLMQAVGAQLLYPLTDLAVMGLRRMIAQLPTFYQVGHLAIRHIRTARPDAVVMIDYPGFHLAVAQRIRSFGIPTYYFVPPQIWAWRQWRVRHVRQLFTGVLTALPFEDDWYRQRRVATHYIGHPYFDELARQKLDPAFVAAERNKSGTRVTLLPGSRDSEVAANAPILLTGACKIHAIRPDVRFLIAAFNEHHAEVLRAQLPARIPIDVHVGRTPELIELADACVAVSGSVSLELLYRAKPAVIIYRVNKLYRLLARVLVKTKYITLVNLLANDELYPEILGGGDESDRVAAYVLGWLNDPIRRAVLVNRLTTLRDRVAIPGACDRAASLLLNRKATVTRAAA